MNPSRPSRNHKLGTGRRYTTHRGLSQVGPLLPRGASQGWASWTRPQGSGEPFVFFLPFNLA